MAVIGTTYSDPKALKVNLDRWEREAQEEKVASPLAALAQWEPEEDAALRDPEAWRG